jgi:hypothetical protein
MSTSASVVAGSPVAKSSPGQHHTSTAGSFDPELFGALSCLTHSAGDDTILTCRLILPRRIEVPVSVCLLPTGRWGESNAAGGDIGQLPVQVVMVERVLIPDCKFAERAQELLGRPLYEGRFQVVIPTIWLQRSQYLAVTVAGGVVALKDGMPKDDAWVGNSHAGYVEFTKNKLNRHTSLPFANFLIISRKNANRRIARLSEHPKCSELPVHLVADVMVHLLYSLISGNDTALLTAHLFSGAIAMPTEIDIIVYGAIRHVKRELYRQQQSAGILRPRERGNRIGEESNSGSGGCKVVSLDDLHDLLPAATLPPDEILCAKEDQDRLTEERDRLQVIVAQGLEKCTDDEVVRELAMKHLKDGIPVSKLAKDADVEERDLRLAIQRFKNKCRELMND